MGRSPLYSAASSPTEGVRSRANSCHRANSSARIDADGLPSARPHVAQHALQQARSWYGARSRELAQPPGVRMPYRSGRGYSTSLASSGRRRILGHWCG